MCGGSARHRASPSRSPTPPGPGSTRWANRSDADLKPMTSASPWARADLCVDRRSRSARMEHRRGRPDQARSRRRSDPAHAGALCARRAPAFRPGQMVSGRKPAALGVRPVLAQGRRADLEEPRADRPDGGRAPGQDRRGRALRRRHRAAARHRHRLCAAGLRGPRPLAAEGSRLPDNVRSDRQQIGRSGGARPDGAGVRFRAQRAEGLRAADPALECRRRSLAQRALEIPPRQPVPDAGRFPLGLRLPIASLPYIAPEDYPYIVEQDPMEPRDPLSADGTEPEAASPQQAREKTPRRAAPVRTRDVDRDPRRPCCAPSCRRWRSSRTISN